MAKSPHRIPESRAMSTDYRASRAPHDHMNHMVDNGGSTAADYSYTKSMPNTGKGALKTGYTPKGDVGDTSSDPPDYA